MFDFIKKRKIFYIISCLVIVCGIASMCVQGLNLGIDFVGGSVLQAKFEEKMPIEDLRSSLSKMGHDNVSIQQLDEGDYQLKMEFMDQAAQDKFLAELQDQTGKSIDIVKATAVGPSVGQEILSKGLLALGIALILMIIYISIRFEWRFAIAGIIALFHDILVTLSIFSIFQFEVDSSFVAAVLTIFGYSINDTIVVFDRIRERIGGVKRDDLGNVVNSGIYSTMRRSLYTSLSTLLPLLAVLIFGGDTTKLFVLAMIIGIASGTYSSICMASPLWYDISMKSKKKRF